MFVFGVKYRLGLIDASWRDKLYSVIGQAAKQYDCIPLAIGGMRDHIHVLVSVKGNAPAIKTIIAEIKAKSSKWVNDNRLTLGRFGWQEGNSKFSYSYRELAMMKNYINNQQKHHLGMSYREEMKRLLDAAGVAPRNEDLPEDLQ